MGIAPVYYVRVSEKPIPIEFATRFKEPDRFDRKYELCPADATHEFMCEGERYVGRTGHNLRWWPRVRSILRMLLGLGKTWYTTDISGGTAANWDQVQITLQDVEQMDALYRANKTVEMEDLPE